MRKFLVFLSLLGLALLGGSMPPAQAQIAVQVGPAGVIVGEPPVCEYGYYDYEPYACAPDGFYGSGYFFNGIFIGVGPWANWGYEHGWGRERFRGADYGGHGYGYRDHAVTHQGYGGSYRGGNEARGQRGNVREEQRGNRVPEARGERGTTKPRGMTKSGNTKPRGTTKTERKAEERR